MKQGEFGYSSLKTPCFFVDVESGINQVLAGVLKDRNGGSSLNWYRVRQID